MIDHDATPPMQISFFENAYECDRCNAVAHAESPDQLPAGWKLVGKGFVCTRKGKRGCEQIEMHYCAACVSQTS